MYVNFWLQLVPRTVCLLGSDSSQSLRVQCTFGASERPWVTPAPRCSYRWLYELICGLQHVESTQAFKLCWKRQRSCRTFDLFWPQNSAPPPNLTSGLLGFIVVILDFKTLLFCFTADMLDFNYSNAAFLLSCDVITHSWSISLR